MAEYVEAGFANSGRQPFQGSPAVFHYFALPAPLATLQQLCRTVFGGTSVTVEPTGPWVLLAVGFIEALRPTDPGLMSMGYADEHSASFFIPVTVGTRRFSLWWTYSAAAFPPLMVVDNPLSLVNGREIFGLNKAGGSFHFDTDFPGPVAGAGAARYRWPSRIDVSVFGLDSFGQGTRADNVPLLQITRRVGWGAFAMSELHTAGDLGEICGRKTLAQLPGIGDFITSFIDLNASMDHITLRQFRSPVAGEQADLQQVIFGPVQVPRLSVLPIYPPDVFDVDVRPVATHPLGQVLGLASGRAPLVWRVEADVILDNGQVRWSA